MLIRRTLHVALTATVVAVLTVVTARYALYADLLAQRAVVDLERALLESARHEAREERERFIEALVDIAVPPSNDKLYTVTTLGIGAAETQIRTDSVTTTEEAAFTTDLTTAQQTNATTQLVFIKNLDAVDDLCYRNIAWTVAGATCDAKCNAGSVITCSLAATDGIHLAPGESVTREYDGTNCICVVGEDVAGVPYQTERSIR